ncbi:hypothetical protein BV25DRAFT_296543 [Artomyces pyxidatus]|uniref:Uncharacterized protein n=1 Tax=Artomyces pyxidatus TaxID=48021 RepID=A0ACB8T8H9_9AGAM|nr:hypothetical protein BV25DRAFT_296543 [Artomyces pyxidatus]
MYKAWFHYRARRNKLAPISRLPPEILLRILLLHINSYDSHAASTNFPPWIDITYVCCHWRAVALESAMLWRNVDFSRLSGKWVGAFLVRSQSIPITIVCDEPKRSSVERLVHHLHHLERLTLVSTQQSDENAFHDVCVGLPSAPQLRFLALSTAYLHALPEDVFRGFTPRLRLLELCNITGLPLEARLTPHLTTFVIRYTQSLNTDHSLSLPFDQLFDFSGELPALKSLCLENCVPRRPAQQPTNRSALQLRNLKVLILGGERTDCICMLNHLVLPHLTTVTILLPNFSGLEGATIFNTVFAAIPVHLLPDPAMPRYHAKVWHAWGQTAGTPDFHTELRRFSDDGTKNRLALGISIETRGRRDLYGALVDQFLEALPAEIRSAHMRKLVLCPSLKIQQLVRTDWPRMLRETRELKVLNVHGIIGLLVCKTLADSLVTVAGQPAGDAPPAIVLPKLSSLVLQDFDFANPFPCIQGRMILYIPMYKGIVKYLRARHQADTPLDTLRVMGHCSNGKWDWLDELTDVVGSVVRFDVVEVDPLPADSLDVEE